MRLTVIAGAAVGAIAAAGDDGDDDDVAEDNRDEKREDDNQDGESKTFGAGLLLLSKRAHPNAHRPQDRDSEATSATGNHRCSLTFAECQAGSPSASQCRRNSTSVPCANLRSLARSSSLSSRSSKTAY